MTVNIVTPILLYWLELFSFEFCCQIPTSVFRVHHMLCAAVFTVLAPALNAGLDSNHNVPCCIAALWPLSWL